MPIKKRTSFEVFAHPLLLLILLLAALLRFSGLNWDDGTHLHPDERFLTTTTIKLHSSQWVRQNCLPNDENADSFYPPNWCPEMVSESSPLSGVLDYLHTSTSTLNPYNAGEGFYVYGNFPMTVTRLVAEWSSDACENELIAPCPFNPTGYDGLHLLGRFLSGFVDLIAVAFIFFIGRRLYGWQAGLIAAGLLATAVMPIQQSHFYTMDTWASTFTTITIYAAVRVAGLGDKTAEWRWRYWVIFGVMLGLTMASRINLAPLALIINVSALIWLHRRGHSWQNIFDNGRLPDLTRVILGIMVSALLSIIVFRFANPYAFADPAIARNAYIAEHGVEPPALLYFLQSTIGFNPQWLSNMEEIQSLQSPDASFPPATQWVSRAPILFPFSNMVLYGMGIGAGMMAWIGFLWAGWRLIRRKPDWANHAIPVVWSALYFVFMATRWVKSTRYFLPIYPALLLLGGWVLVTVCRRASRTQVKWKQIGAAALTAVILLSSFLWANGFTQIYRQPMTRNAASEWMYENVPTAVTILYKVDGTPQELQLPVKRIDWMQDSMPFTIPFTLPKEGTVTAVRLNHTTDPHYLIGQPLSSAQLKVNLGPIGGDGVTLDLDLDNQPRPFIADIADQPLMEGEQAQLVIEHSSGAAVNARTSLLANEHWDDLLPTSISGHSAYGLYYTEVDGGQRPVTHPDNPQKRAELIQWLDDADYIILSSQRALWSLPRIPATYPMMIRYYEALFNGDIGFELAHESHGNIHIGPLYISDTAGKVGWGALPKIGWPPPGDLAAEEAFSVYDHPPVWIFKKMATYSPEKTAAVFNAVDLNNVIFMTPRQATEAASGDLPPTLLLSDDDAAVQRAGGTFNELFHPDGLLAQHPWLAAAVWWTAVTALGWLAFPITFTAFNGLPDKGFALSRVLSLLLVSYFGWLMASLKLLPHSRGTLALGVLLIAILSSILFARRRREMEAFLRQNGRYLLLVEMLGIGLFLLYILIRLGNPDVWDIIWGGEKPMDLAYFTAVMKSTSFPPYDPWYAGGTLNYYYYGFVYVGAMAKLLAIPPAIAYNTGLAMLFSFVGLSVFGLAFNLTIWQKNRGAMVLPSPKSADRTRFKTAVAAGLIAMSLAILLGNLGEPAVVVNAWYKTGDPALETKLPVAGTFARIVDGGIKIAGGQPAPVYPGDYFWSATRLINANAGEVQPISEFPFFTFIYGDLHAHMISMPLQLLALGWAIGLVLGVGGIGDRRLGIRLGLSLLIGGVAIGALRATNTWDFPTYLGIGALALFYWAWRRGNGRFTQKMAIEAGMGTAVLWATAFLTFLPYAQNYGTAYASLSRWQGSYTHVSKYLIMWGMFLFLLLPHLTREFRAWSDSLTPARLRKKEPFGWLLLIALFVYIFLLITLWFKLHYWIAPIVLTLILSAGLLSLRRHLSPPRRILLVLTAAALFLTLFVEVFVLEGDIGRMNTVFKFYMQAWLMLSVVGGVTAVSTYTAIRSHRLARTIWSTLFAVLILTAFLYPVLATKAKWQIRMSKESPHTLDGMAFMPYVEYADSISNQTITLDSDYEAIRWMQRNIAGSPVIAEAHSGNPYRSIGNRVAMYTGLPAIVGWDWHQRQQRAVLPDNGIAARIAAVTALYNTLDIALARTILDKYDVGYIYVGQLEWAYYDPNGLNKFDQMAAVGVLEEVYRNAGTSIYKVVRE